MIQTKSVKYTIKGQGLNTKSQSALYDLQVIAKLKMGIADVDLVPLMHIIADLKSVKHDLHLMRANVSEYDDFLFSTILSAMYLKKCEVILDIPPVDEKTRG